MSTVPMPFSVVCVSWQIPCGKYAVFTVKAKWMRLYKKLIHTLHGNHCAHFKLAACPFTLRKCCRFAVVDLLSTYFPCCVDISQLLGCGIPYIMRCQIEDKLCNIWSPLGCNGKICNCPVSILQRYRVLRSVSVDQNY